MPAAKKKKLTKRKTSVRQAHPADVIAVRGASQNNLKGIDLDLPLGKFTVITGPSGSGKSSLAFQTIYAEGQRRYVETFSPYTRQFFDRMDKPLVDEIHGIPPAIAIEQTNTIRTTRSTVGTITEINDYLKLLFPRLATGYDPETGEEVRPETPASVAAFALAHYTGQVILVTFPVPVPSKTRPKEFFEFLQGQGFLRIHVFGKTYRTDEPDAYKRKTLPAKVPIIQDRITVSEQSKLRLLEALESAFELGKGELSLSPSDGTGNQTKTFSTSWDPLRPPVPGLFSFNSPLGACPTCRGFGKTVGIDIGRAIPDHSFCLADGAIKAFQGHTYSGSQTDLERCARIRGLDIECPFEDLPAEDQKWVLEGDRTEPDETYQNNSWYGVRGFFKWLESNAYKMHVRVFLSRYRSYTTCPDCRGTRLKPEALHFKIGSRSLPELWQMPVSELAPFVGALTVPPSDHTTTLVKREITSRLRYLVDVGLGYLNLDRESRTLSGGEIQRVNLTTCLGASLTNTLFVLDEPSIGLHPRDTGRLISVMEGLRDKGNTLLVVEHEEAVIRAAENLVDIGPGRGEHGGELVYHGPPNPTKKRANTNSLTLDYLTGKKTIPVPKKRRKPKRGQHLKIVSASQHNLKKINVTIPLGLFSCVTGVSGSGKSTLVHDVLYENLLRKRGDRTENEPGRCRDISGHEKIGDLVMVDQSPLSRTPRSTTAVYVGTFDLVRRLFGETEEARSQGLTMGFFSFNSGGGRCERCSGNGFEKVEMQFLSDLYVICPECAGRRYQKAALEILLDGKSVADVLDLTVTEATTFFSSCPDGTHSNKITRLRDKIVGQLELVASVGLGYLRLGQPLNTLSGGESQRLKLVGHLLENSGANPALLIFDEPTTGLHFDDIRLLLEVFQRLVDQGNTLVVIEHNLDVIKCADHVIDLGPGGGNAGGSVVSTGTPEEIARCRDSHTGRFLSPLLAGKDYPVQDSFPALLAAEEDDPYHAGNTRSITIAGARENNLKDLTVQIPRDELVVVTGLSGSGKSTLAFDIIFAEGQRRFLDSMSTYARQFVTQMEKPDVDSISGLPPTVAIEQRVSQGGGKSTVATVTEVYQFLRLLFAKVGVQHCPDSGVPVVSQTESAITHAVSEHAKKGTITVLAPVIRGRKGYHTEVATWARKRGYTHLFVDRHFKEVEGFQRLERFKEHDVDVVVGVSEGKKPKLQDLRNAVKEALAIGKGTLRLLDHKNQLHTLSTQMVSPVTGRSFEPLDPRLFSYNSPHGWCRECRGYGYVYKKARHLDTERFKSVLEAELDEEQHFTRTGEDELLPCPGCGGARLNADARAVQVRGHRIGELSRLTVTGARKAIAALKFTGRDKLIARDIVPEITQRLQFMEEVGLGYLQLDRSAKTLSGGEAQRIRLAAQLGSNLRGVLYVLDEPTIGLHPRDNVRLLDTLTKLRDRGNSLLVVEHDEETMARADHLLDLGPGAGRFGGEIVYQGNPQTLLAKPQKNGKGSRSATVQALSAGLSHPYKGERRPLPGQRARTGWLRVKGACANNLKNIDVQIPLGRLTVITGISGSGKSTLMRRVLKPAVQATLSKKKTKTETRDLKSLAGAGQLSAVYEVDQAPIGKTSRSCPATYIKVFDEIRKLFSATPNARVRGYTPSRFSFNTEGGRCESCKGNGRIKLEMNFLPTTWVPCEDCNGLRYNAATLEVDYNGKNIGQVMQMSITEAAGFFATNPKIHRALQLLVDTGTGYLQLGQPSPTLSGGEAQRIKLVTELTRGIARTENARIRKNQTPKGNLYLIEEPTIGLHMADVIRLTDVLHRLVDDGHTVIVIEHNTDIIAEADYIIDIGPEAGAAGGKLVACGTPEEVARSKTSRTAPFLKALL